MMDDPNRSGMSGIHREADQGPAVPTIETESETTTAAAATETSTETSNERDVSVCDGTETETQQQQQQLLCYPNDDDDHIIERDVRDLRERLRLLEEQAEERERTVGDMREGFRRRLLKVETDRNALLKQLEENNEWFLSQLIVEFGLGVLGWAPPLFIDPDTALINVSMHSRKRPHRLSSWISVLADEPSVSRDFCVDGVENEDRECGPQAPPGGDSGNHQENDDDDDDDDDERGSAPSSSGSDGDNGCCSSLSERIWRGVRRPFYVFVSVVDFADAVMDIAVSITDIIDPEDDVQGWALWLFTMTAIARTIGGLFGVVYRRIEDKNDREISYFMVELTILAIEDIAAFVYITIKRFKVGEIDPIDVANLYLTILCAFLFTIPIMWRYRLIVAHLPLYAKWFLPVCFVFLCAYPFIRGILLAASTVREHIDLICRLMYGTVVPMQVFLLYRWSRYLFRKTATNDVRRQRRREEHTEKRLSVVELPAALPALTEPPPTHATRSFVFR